MKYFLIIPIVFFATSSNAQNVKDILLAYSQLHMKFVKLSDSALKAGNEKLAEVYFKMAEFYGGRQYYYHELDDANETQARRKKEKQK